MRGLPSILSLFRNEFNKFNNTGARMLDSIYHMKFTLLYNRDLALSCHEFIIFLRNVKMDAMMQHY